MRRLATHHSLWVLVMVEALPAAVAARIPERQVEPVVLFRAPATARTRGGVPRWRMLPTAHPVRIVHGVDGDLSRAQIAIEISDDTRLVGEAATLETGTRAIPAMTDAVVAVAVVDPKVRVRAGQDGRRFLFQGFPQVSDSGWGGPPQGSGESIVIHARCLLTRWDDDTRAQVYGRFMRPLEEARDLDPENGATWISTPKRVATLPALFNFDGKPNRAALPARIRVGPSVDASGFVEVPIFSDDDAPGAGFWSVGQVLRYLLWFHRPKHAHIDSDAVLALTDHLVKREPSSTGGLDLASTLARRADGIGVEGISLLNALRVVADRAGLHFGVDYDARPKPALKLWAVAEPVTVDEDNNADPAVKWFYVEEPGTDQSGRTRGQVLSRNNTDQIQIATSYADVRNHVTVLGAQKRYAFWAELRPGWKPEADLDNVQAADEGAALAKVLFDEPGQKIEDLEPAQRQWYDRYVRQNTNETFRARVGRWWVLNEGGDYPAASYARTVGPFQSGAYTVFDFAKAIPAIEPGSWAMIRRRLLPLPVDRRSAEAEGDLFNPHLAIAHVIIELSFDGSSQTPTWVRPKELTARIMTDQCGIAIETPWLSSITPPGVDRAEDNWWHAMIRGDAKVGVTAMVIGDDRIEEAARSQRGLFAGPLRAALVDAGDAFAHRQVSGTLADAAKDGLIQEADGLDIDDSRHATALAKHSVGLWQDRVFSVRAAIPWTETYYRIGDRVQGVVGRGVRFERLFDDALVVPSVVAVQYEFAEGGVTTNVLLEDLRLAPEV